MGRQTSPPSHGVDSVSGVGVTSTEEGKERARDRTWSCGKKRVAGRSQRGAEGGGGRQGYDRTEGGVRRPSSRGS